MNSYLQTSIVQQIISNIPQTQTVSKVEKKEDSQVEEDDYCNKMIKIESNLGSNLGSNLENDPESDSGESVEKIVVKSEKSKKKKKNKK
jgi:hypothetical protein